MLRLLTGEGAADTSHVEGMVTLNGRVSGFLGAVPTNLGAAGVAVTVTVYALDPATVRAGAINHGTFAQDQSAAA